jgi:hypothetical protein
MNGQGFIAATSMKFAGRESNMLSRNGHRPLFERR